MILIQLLLAAQVATAPPSRPAQAPASDSADEKLVCHLETNGASRIAERICHTKAEWAEIERQTEEDFKSNMGKQNDPGNSPQ
jgi:hypothetical protein